MIETIKESKLFRGMTGEEISSCLGCANYQVVRYEKNEIIFYQEEVPEYLMMIIEGRVTIGKDFVDGKRNILTTFQRSGELFGEVLLYLEKQRYDYFAQAECRTTILKIPKDFVIHSCANECVPHKKMIDNMIFIFAEKAYFLNQRLQIMSCASLRQKIARMLMIFCEEDVKKPLRMTRESMADFLSVARPSLSRELMKMKKEGLIDIQGQDIYAIDFVELESTL